VFKEPCCLSALNEASGIASIRERESTALPIVGANIKEILVRTRNESTAYHVDRVRGKM